MADTNIYQSFENIKKYTTQEKFDAIDLSDVPLGTEYNIVGLIEEADLSTSLLTKINKADNAVTSVNGSIGAVTLKTVMGQEIVGTGDIPIAKATASSIGGISLTNTYAASTSTFGLVKLGNDTVIDGSSAKTYPIQLDSSGKMFVSVPWENNTIYTGGVGINVTNKVIKAKLKTETATDVDSTVADTLQIYSVRVDKSGNLCVPVPWSDTNTTYSAGDGISLTGTTFSLKFATSSVQGGFKTGTRTVGTSKTTVGIDSSSGLLDISIDCGTWS